MESVLTAQQAAALLGTSKPTLRALIDRKVLVATKKTRGSGFQWVIREESVEAFLADHGRYDVDTVAARPSLKRLDQRLSALEVEFGRTKKTRGSGFQWVIREESVEAFLADHGRIGNP